MKFKTALLSLLCCALMLTVGGCRWGHDDGDNSKPATGFEVTSYVDGKVAQKATADSYTTSGDGVDFHLATKDKTGSDKGHFQGTWVVKHNAWKPAVSDKLYSATLYSGKTAVATWTVHGFSTDAETVLLFPADGSEVLRVSGTVVVTELKAGSSDVATARVTVQSGDDLVYSKDFAWCKVLGFHLEGQPADGSGYVYIWGKYKTENLKK